MEYLPVLILMIIGFLVGAGALGLSALTGPNIFHRMKDRPFECGVPPVGDARHRVSVRFYLVAILFLLFDVEAVFFFPWAIVFKEFLQINAAILVSMGFFVGALLVGFYYIWAKGALDWD